MPYYRVRMINSDFESCEERDYPSVDAALNSGIRAATHVAVDAIGEGHSSSAVEIRVEEGGHIVGRRVLSFSVSDLSPGE